MIRLERDFQNWLKENRDFYEHLKEHDSVLYIRFQPVYEVLINLSESEMQNPDEVNKDIEKIFQVGLEYLHSQIDICKIYLEKVFDNDIHALLKYDRIINYVLYIEDLQYELHENEIVVDHKKLDELTKYLETMVVKKKTIPENIDIYIDSKIKEIIGDKDYNFNSIVDIFVEIANTLQIDLYNEEDYVIGKDI